MAPFVREVCFPEKKDLNSTFEIVSKYVPTSPLVKLDDLGRNVWLKLETFRPSGSFKIRGAIAALSRIRQKKVITSSAGNHGLAVAEVASNLGIEATIVVSESASPRKIHLLKEKAHKLIIYGASYDNAEEYGRKLADETGSYYLSPYNDPDIILGQATIGIEILRTFEEPVQVVCSVGGGGLAAGLAMAISEKLGSSLIGVEAFNSAPVRVAIENGRAVPIEIGNTIADGLAGNIEPGSITIDLLTKYKAKMLTVTESEIIFAMKYLAFSKGLMIEGAGATGFAAVLSGKISFDESLPLVIVVSGRNIQFDTWLKAIYSSHY
jgi:threonine dehydratase